MQLLFGAALAALERSGTSPLYFTGKPVGEAFFFRTYFYALGLLAGILILVCFVIAKLADAIGRWRRGTLIRSSRPSFAVMAIPTAGAALGALAAAITNLHEISDEYGEQLAVEERFAVASASALPEMLLLTNTCIGIALALCFGVVMAQAALVMYRRA